jgi:hypothetical protein
MVSGRQSYRVFRTTFSNGPCAEHTLSNLRLTHLSMTHKLTPNIKFDEPIAMNLAFPASCMGSRQLGAAMETFEWRI